jgi:hypothetical protein
MVSRGRLRVLAWHPAALIGLLVAACVIYATATWSRAAGAFFYMDDFVGIQDAGSGLQAAVRPYGGHVSYSAGLIWHSLLKVFGTASYEPFLAMAIILTLGVAVVVFVCVRAMTSDIIAVASATWVLFLGAAFHNQLWDQASLSQLAAISVIGIAVIGLRSKKSVAAALVLAAVGFGVGGLGIGVAFALLALALCARRFLLAAGVLLVIAGVGWVATRSMATDAGASGGFLRSAAAIPSYDFLALESTIAVGLNVPSGIAGALAIAVVILGAVTVPIAVRRAETVADLTLIASVAYLIANWSLAAFVRGLPEEVAAPRYLGVTGPVLLVAIISMSVTLRHLVPVPAWLAPWRMNERWFVGVWTAVLLIAAWGSLPMWLDARTNTAYLGQLNLARLAAMNSGESWIARDFAPSGEGLTYVREVLIQDAWKRRGYPPLSPAEIAKSPQRSDAFLGTALEAGILTSVSDNAERPPRCEGSVSFNAQSQRRFRYFGVSDAAVTLLASMPHPVQVEGETGVLTVNAMRGVGQGTLSSATGCFALLK